MKSTAPSSASPTLDTAPALDAGAYLTDGTRLLRVLRVDADGVEVEDARTEQLEWHPAGELASATRAVKPQSVA